MLYFVLIIGLGLLYWLYLSKTKENIKIRIDGFYKTNREMTVVAFEELKKSGRNCEIIKFSNSFSEIKVDGRVYYVTGMVFGIKGGTTQTITLKPLKD